MIGDYVAPGSVILPATALANMETFQPWRKKREWYNCVTWETWMRPRVLTSSSFFSAFRAVSTFSHIHTYIRIIFFGLEFLKALSVILKIFFSLLLYLVFFHPISPSFGPVFHANFFMFFQMKGGLMGPYSRFYFIQPTTWPPLPPYPPSLTPCLSSLSIIFLQPFNHIQGAVILLTNTSKGYLPFQKHLRLEIPFCFTRGLLMQR